MHKRRALERPMRRLPAKIVGRDLAKFRVNFLHQLHKVLRFLWQNSGDIRSAGTCLVCHKAFSSPFAIKSVKFLALPMNAKSGAGWADFFGEQN